MSLIQSTKRGDTIIEIMFAFAIFAAVAIVTISTMSLGVDTIEESLELVTARNELNAQAEALRFIHSSYISELTLPETCTTSDPAEKCQQYRELWTALTDDSSTMASSASIAAANPLTIEYPLISCSTAYDTSSSDSLVYHIFRLVRFEDTNYNACVQNVDASYNIKPEFKNATAGNPIIDMKELANGVRIELADPQDGFLESSESDVNLDLYELVFFPISQDAVTLRAFFSGTFILATNNGDVNIMRTGDYCDLAQTGADILDLGSGFNYCGMNKFNFAARTAGSGA